MACLCGDTRCSSCGPAQGNTECEYCGRWSDEEDYAPKCYKCNEDMILDVLNANGEDGQRLEFWYCKGSCGTVMSAEDASKHPECQLKIRILMKARKEEQGHRAHKCSRCGEFTKCESWREWDMPLCRAPFSSLCGECASEYREDRVRSFLS